MDGKHYYAIIGSSGGGSATLTSGPAILSSIQQQLDVIENDMLCIKYASLVVCNNGLDFASKSSQASLWVLENKNLALKCSGTLLTVNQVLAGEDKRLASMIKSGEVHALITLSSDPTGYNKNTIKAAIEAGIPIVGTGGQSISTISTFGGNVIGCSGGSVATTAVSRGICFAATLSSYFGYKYYPKTQFSLGKLTSVVGAALPGTVH